jgi:CBS-domain-containing membrane protein
VVAIRDIMSREVFALPASVSLDEAARALVERDIGAAPVRDDAGRVVGVLSRSDLCDRERVAAVRAALDPPRPLGAADLMTPGFAAVHASDPAVAALDLLANEASHRVLVLDEAGALVGLVTAGDLLRALLPPRAGL